MTTDISEQYNRTAAVMIEAASQGAPEPSGDLRTRLMARVEASKVYSVRASDGPWLASAIPGITVKVLSLDRERNMATLLIRAEPGAVYPSHHHSTGEDCYVVSGSILVAGQRLFAGDFHYADAGSDHGELSTETGAEVLLVAAASDYL